MLLRLEIFGTGMCLKVKQNEIAWGLQWEFLTCNVNFSREGGSFLSILYGAFTDRCLILFDFNFLVMLLSVLLISMKLAKFVF